MAHAPKNMWTPQEDEVLLARYDEYRHENRTWAKIAEFLSGRNVRSSSSVQLMASALC